MCSLERLSISYTEELEMKLTDYSPDSEVNEIHSQCILKQPVSAGHHT